MREGFLLDPAIAYLNHGSYGACPRPVFEEYQRFRREPEHGRHFFTRRVARSKPTSSPGRSPRGRASSSCRITSPTALLFPVDEICCVARQASVLTIVDGAHVPGHIPVDLESLGADVYAGSRHKWLCAAPEVEAGHDEPVVVCFPGESYFDA